MTTVNRAEGLCMVRSTPDTAPLVREILSSLPIELALVDAI